MRIPCLQVVLVFPYAGRILRDKVKIMSEKTFIMLGMVIGSFIGGFVPSLFGADMLSFTGLFASGIGAVLGVWLAYRITR